MIKVRIRPGNITGYKRACRWLVDRDVNLDHFVVYNPKDKPKVTVKMDPKDDTVAIFSFPNSLRDIALLFKLSWNQDNKDS